MGFRAFGWSFLALGAAMTIVGFISSAPAALLVSWVGIVCLAVGLIALVLALVEGPAVDERWRRRARRHRGRLG